MSTSTPGDTGNNSDTTPEDVLATPPVADDITSSLRPATSGRGGLPIMTYVLAAVVLVGAGFLAGTMLNKGSDSNTLAGRSSPEWLPGRSSTEWRRPERRGCRWWRRHLRDGHEGRGRYRLRQAGRTERPSPSRRTDRPRCRCRQPERCRTYPRGRRWSCRAVRLETTRSRRRRSRRAASAVRAPGTLPDWVDPAADGVHLHLTESFGRQPIGRSFTSNVHRAWGRSHRSSAGSRSNATTSGSLTEPIVSESSHGSPSK